MGGQRIAVVGVGAIGGAVAADLADLERHDVTLCTRTRFDRLEVVHPRGTSVAEARVVTDPSSVAAVDWVLLATKAHQSPGARPWLDALCDERTTVAVLQNGADHIERIRPLVAPAVRVLATVVRLPAEKTAPGRVQQGRDGSLFVPDNAAGRTFAALFEGSRIEVAPREDFHAQVWWKLLSNSALGGICALTLRPNGAVAEPGLRGLAIAVMREVVLVARAEGAPLPDDAPEEVLARIVHGAPEHWSSIAVDRREGRPMEWRARNGIVCERARLHGIATPLNDAVTTLLEAADAGAA